MTAGGNTGDSEQAYEELADEFRMRGAVLGAMFGRRALKRDGKVFALLQDDALACSLGAGTAEHAAALAVEGSYLFDPSRTGRPFKDWVSIPFGQAALWHDFAAAAFDRVAS
jgi:hypothetical protein